jgi:hypothetical protein
VAKGDQRKQFSGRSEGRSESDPATAENYENSIGSRYRGKRNEPDACRKPGGGSFRYHGGSGERHKRHRTAAIGDIQCGTVADDRIRHGIENMDLHLRWQPYSHGTHE